MSTKNLRAVFATDRLDFMKRVALSEAEKSNTSPVSVVDVPSAGGVVEATGPAQDIMHFIGAVAFEGEDFLVGVVPC